MNLHGIPIDRIPIRGLQKEVETLKKKNEQLEAENIWLKKMVAEMHRQEDKLPSPKKIFSFSKKQSIIYKKGDK